MLKQQYRAHTPGLLSRAFLLLALLASLTACDFVFFDDDDDDDDDKDQSSFKSSVSADESNGAGVNLCVDEAEIDCASRITESGFYTLISSGLEREFYLQLPTNYPVDAVRAASVDAPPLLILLHGAGDSIQGWFAGGFQGDGLLQLAKDDAIVVIPNARPDDQGRRIWDPGTETDYEFFSDLFYELEERTSFDRRRIYVAGHSAGGLMAHELGCQFGSIVRAVAPSAGSITSSPSPRCTGSVAVLQIQSEFDEIVPLGVVTKTRDYWALYNGFDPAITTAGITEPCVDYSLGASAYPVQWCLHQTTEFDGHNWWSQADQAIWDFFTALPVVEPTVEPPPGGGNSQVEDQFPTTVSITIDIPLTLGTLKQTGLFLYPEDALLPIRGAPNYILNGFVDLSPATPGTTADYVIPVELPPDTKLPASFSLVLAAYVVGGSMPIPTPGVDHNLIYPVTIFDSTTPIIIPDVVVLEAVKPVEDL